MAEELDIIVSVTDKSAAELDKINGNLDKITKGAQKVGAAFTVAGALITGAVAISIKAFQEQERAEARLEKIATQVTGATAEQVQGFKDLAGEMQKVGVVGDEVVIAGQSQLASFASNAETVEILSGSLADLAVAQNGVTVTQDQSIATANLLGKALGGRLGALTVAGIQVSKEQEAAFKATNDEMERAEILANIIASNYGGLNEAMRATSEGGMQALRNDFGDITEKIGEALIPVLIAVVGFLSPIVEGIAAWVEKNPQLFQTIAIVVAAIGGLMVILGPLLLMLGPIITAVGVVGTVFAFLVSPIGLVVLAIGAVIAIGVLLYTQWDKIAPFFASLWDTIKNAFTDTIAVIRAFVEEHFGFLIGFLEFWWSVVTSIFNVGILVLTAVWNVAWDVIKTVALAVWDVIKGAVTLAFNFLKGIFDTHMDSIKAIWSAAWDTFGPIVTGIFDGIKAGVKGSLNFIIGMLNRFISATNKVTGVLNKVPGVEISQISSIPLLAKGGDITGSGAAVVGEDGPELLQLNKGARVTPLSGGAGGITVNIIDAQILNDDDIVEKIGDPIMRALKMHFATV